MDPSFLSRQLKTRVELTVPQLRKVEAFLSDAPADELAAKAERLGPNKLRVFGYAATSDGDRIAVADDRILDYLELPPGLDLDPEEYFVVLPVGSSMEPRVFAGEPQVVRKGYPPARGKKVLIEFNDGTAVIKDYRGQRDGKVFAEQWNPARLVDYDASSIRALHLIQFSL